MKKLISIFILLSISLMASEITNIINKQEAAFVRLNKVLNQQGFISDNKTSRKLTYTFVNTINGKMILNNVYVNLPALENTYAEIKNITPNKIKAAQAIIALDKIYKVCQVPKYKNFLQSGNIINFQYVFTKGKLQDIKSFNIFITYEACQKVEKALKAIKK